MSEETTKHALAGEGSENNTPRDEIPRDFIRAAIQEDLCSGRFDRVHTRFPPEPNGYLHIGHAKAICIDFGIPEDFGGKCNLRYDDTNPVKEDVEYVDSIKEDIHWLGYDWEEREFYSFGLLRAALPVFIFSNSGVNCLPVEMALYAREKGMFVVSVSASAYAEVAPLSPIGIRLSEVSDIAVDNGGVPGDALVHLGDSGWRVGPSSTVLGALIWTCLVCECVS